MSKKSLIIIVNILIVILIGTIIVLKFDLIKSQEMRDCIEETIKKYPDTNTGDLAEDYCIYAKGIER